MPANPYPTQNPAEALKVSFIIAAYNLPTWMLRQCVDSILALSLLPDEREIILVDDGSDESAQKGLEDYARYLIYIRQTNRGLSHARNTGMEAATGTYIQFVDGDDSLIPRNYDYCLDIARHHAPDIVMFHYSHHSEAPHYPPVGDGKSMGSRRRVSQRSMANGTDIMRNQNVRASACGYLFKRSILGNLRFTEGIYHEDEEFTPQLLLQADSVIQTDAKAYFYRLRENSITTSQSQPIVEKRINDLKGVITRLHQLTDTLPSPQKEAMQRRVAQLTMDYIYKVIVDRRSHSFLLARLQELRKEKLFPLPKERYTKKYVWFRRLTNSKIGCWLLVQMMPRVRK